jgi:hypothetical protein
MTKAASLNVGDLLRITGHIPHYGKHHTLLPETIRVWKKLAKRGRPVRIFKIDEYGMPWYRCRFKRKNGGWEHHWLNVMDEDANWVLVSRKRRNHSGGA